MADVIWTESALQDLAAIAEYIALDKLSATKGLVQKVFSSTDHLEEFPEMGRAPPELIKSRYLELVVNPCRVFYRIDQQRVLIIYVMRSERKLRQYMLEASRSR